MNNLHTISLFVSILSLGFISLVHAQEKPGVPHSTLPNDNPEMELNQFAYGACWKYGRSQKHWQPIIANKPQFWLWLGDNIYGDTEDMQVLADKYQQLGTTPGYVALKQTCPVLATWDDHDYGKNDAGNDYAKRDESQKVFLNFFNERKDSPRWKRPGVYTSYYFGKGEKRVQLILLDTRYFRTPLKSIEGKPPYRPMGIWTPDSSPDAAMLGEAQWKWLETELGKPARIRFIGTSIQFCAPHNGFEAWVNMPLEKQKMIDLIKSTRAEGVVFLSGDIHSSELCIDEPKGCYPLVDYTSSSLNVPLGGSATRRRVGPAYGGPNFGLVRIDWNPSDPVIHFSTKDTRNDTRLHHAVPLSRLTFAEKNLATFSTTKDFGREWQTFFGPMNLTDNGNGKWTGKCADRTLTLSETESGLTGTWQGKNRSGKVNFRLSRDGEFLYGEYSDDGLPIQLDWAGWTADWEKHFKRDTYHLRKKKKQQ